MEEQQQAVYCAVAVAGEEWKANLRWALASFFPRGSSRRLVLAHVHRPPSRINMMGAWVPVSQLAEEEVTAFRQLEEDRINKVLDDVLVMCKSQKVRASKIIIASDDAARGLIQLVHDHGVTELVMGAASDRGYTRKMRAPRSKKALTVQRKANPSCKIWFVCKGNLICTREANEGLNRAESSTSSASSRSSASDYSRSKPSPHHNSEPATSSAEHTPSREDDNHEAALVAGLSALSVSEIVEEAAVMQEGKEELATTSHSHDDSDAGEMDGNESYEKLKDALLEAENLRHEAYEETRRRQKAERDLTDASKMAMDAESSCRREARHRKEVEERLERESAAAQREKQELDGILDRTREVDDRCANLELQITGSERKMRELQARLSEAHGLLDALRRQRERSRRREDPATAATTDGEASFLRLDYSELEEATGHFDEAARIGLGGDAGGRGVVYRGKLRGMAVAVKMLSRDAAVDEARFTREVEAISRARHPDLVAVVGAFPEARAVVYELVPGGSLEERLGLGAAALPWHARCGVAYRTCAALAFLHSTATAHGDVRPGNILLLEDEQRRSSGSKLSGLGMRRLAARRGSGGAALAYVDPQLLATGEATPEHDVYALGVVLLRLVTGKAAFAAKKAAREAAAGGRRWDEVLDGWPVEHGRAVALAALECCCDVGPRRRERGARELLEAARGALEEAMSAAPGRTPSASAPACFVCPIVREVMREPEIAGDGFTYEAAAMREWLDGGHDTSPMTNLKLPTLELVPNHALRAAIAEWQRHRRL